MNLKGIILAFLSVGVISAYGEDNINFKVVHLVDSIKTSLCNKDTLTAISRLERLERVYPRDGMILITNKILGDLYLSQNKTRKSLDKLLYALNYTAVTYPFRNDSAKCDKLFNSFLRSGSKADVCISISKAYIRLKKFDSSIYYLNLADNKYLPYKGCGNGIISYKSYLSLFFADHYLVVGDTSAAINRLLDFFMLPDGDMKALTNKLRQILSAKYSSTEINREVSNGLKNIKIVKGGKDEPDRVLEFTLFNHKIVKNAYDKTLDTWKQTITAEPSIRQLMQ